MTVEFEPKGKDSFFMSVPNGTWFALVNTSEIKELIGKQYTNDPVDVDAPTAKKMAAIIAGWQPAADWVNGISHDQMKEQFIEFFNASEGFTTY